MSNVFQFLRCVGIIRERSTGNPTKGLPAWMLSSNEFPVLLQTSYSGDIITHLVRVEMRLFVAENCHLAVYPALMANLCKSWIAFIFFCVGSFGLLQVLANLRKIQVLH